jgi:DUF1680 family protein
VFELDIPLQPRYVSPHPFTNQDTIALARGPVVYCLEDVDNTWVNDHFKALLLDPTGRITESSSSIPGAEEPYVGLTAHNAASFIHADGRLSPPLPLGSVASDSRDAIKDLHFIPFALRDNRGGRGHMRVGIRKKH